jgi:hypothetical protein
LVARCDPCAAPFCLQLEDLRSEFAAFQAASEATAGNLQQRLVAAEAQREMLEAAHSNATSKAERLATDLAESRALGTPQVAAAARICSCSSNVTYLAPALPSLFTPAPPHVTRCPSLALPLLPQGNAAKTTVKLAFEKIRGLQQDLEKKHRVR